MDVNPSKVYTVTFDVTADQIREAHMNGQPWPVKFMPGRHTKLFAGHELITRGMEPYLIKLNN